MGENFTYQCSKCEKKYNTSGPWEFYRNKEGKRMPYGFPGPVTQEARFSGVEGLFADMLCLDCGNEVNVIIEEFNRRAVESKGFKGFSKFMSILKKEKESAVRCPNCKSVNLFLSEEGEMSTDGGETGVTCPDCKEGKLILIDHWTP
ncbi:MAG: hypothetical protein ACLFPF_06720 [Halanaerobiales bacterium]